MTSEERDAGLLRALRSLSAPVAAAHGTHTDGDWVAADSVASHARHNGYADVSAVGAGRILSRLAREGRALAQFNGYMSHYKHPDWARGAMAIWDRKEPA